MSKPEAIQGAVDALAGLPIVDNEPVFSEPWEAQAFAMAVALNEKGMFTWTEWADTLSDVIKREEVAGTGLSYYEHWMLALEEIVRTSGLANAEEMAERKEAWNKAARSTPHGQPIEL